MRVTTQGDYALKCVLHIAKNGASEPVPIRRMAQDEGLPLDYIEQLLMKLRRRKLLKSVRGARGGYLLNKRPGAITVKDVLEAVEGEAFEIICGRRRNKNSKKCLAPRRCRLKGFWVRLKARIEEYLKKETIQSLLERSYI